MLHALHPFEAVLFDLDGTLVATDRFWPDAARAGALRAFERLGLQRELPSAEDWMGLVGLPLESGFDALFHDLDPATRAEILADCVEEEHRLLAEGRAGWLPGVVETMQALHDAGVQIGVASNCSQSYLDAMLQGLGPASRGLGRWVHAAYCLQTPGIRDKADMIEELLILFQTRFAVMVGDRDGDRRAAWANGIPHVHLTRGYARRGEEVPAEAILPGMDALIPRLSQRRHWVQATLTELALGSGGVLGLLGPPGAGKAWLAADLAREMRALGTPVQVHALDDRIDWTEAGTDRPEEDLEVLAAKRLSTERLPAPDEAPGGWQIWYGSLLHQPRVLQHLDRIVVLRVDPEVSARRLMGERRGRRPAMGGPAAERPIQRADWTPQQAQAIASLEWGLQDRYPPEAIGHVVLDGSLALGPEPEPETRMD